MRALAGQPVRQIAADEAGAAGDQHRPAPAHKADIALGTCKVLHGRHALLEQTTEQLGLAGGSRDAKMVMAGIEAYTFLYRDVLGERSQRPAA